ncbi:MAG: Fumble domain-containing protein [Anaerolineaceae bacterium]
MRCAVDFGLTNIDFIVRRDDGRLSESMMIPNQGGDIKQQFRDTLLKCGHVPTDFEKIAVTGGRSHQLAGGCDGAPVFFVKEEQAIGCGGLELAGADAVLSVSAGSGTAMIAARRDKTGKIQAVHITGSAVGGGTLQGLAYLLFGTTDALEIDRLAREGNANNVDLSLLEAVGSRVGNLPEDANAVNFGQVVREQGKYSDADVAAGLVRLVAQVVTVIAVNAARAQALEKVVFIGHLADLPSINRELNITAGYYQTPIIIPEKPGRGTVTGALVWMETQSGITSAPAAFGQDFHKPQG